MDYSDYGPLERGEGSTSYFSTPEQNLDPSLFEGFHMLPNVRQWILSTVHNFLASEYIHPESWTRLWVAGSGVSYQWAADREPADLDVMLGIDYVKFRQANPEYSGLSDSEVASMLNEDMHEGLYPEISRMVFGKSTFEVTVYVNLAVSANLDGVQAINPYAAYDVTSDEWSVPPNPKPMVRVHPSWDVSVETDRQRADEILRQYGDLLTQVQNASNPAHRVNAERQFKQVVSAGSALFDEIHEGRRSAFGPAGKGYSDFTNYRWQTGKRTGVIQAMRLLKDYEESARSSSDLEIYGMSIPDSETLIRRASTSYRAPR